MAYQGALARALGYGTYKGELNDLSPSQHCQHLLLATQNRFSTSRVLVLVVLGVEEVLEFRYGGIELEPLLVWR